MGRSLEPKYILVEALRRGDVQETALQHALGQFLDEQRHAVGALDDLLDHVIGQRLPAGILLDQRGPVAPVQAIERQHADLRLASPRRLELGTEPNDQQYRQAADMLDGEVEQLVRGRVDPMRVLENHDHRLPARACRRAVRLGCAPKALARGSGIPSICDTPIAIIALVGLGRRRGKCDRQDQKGDRRTEGAWATTGSAV
jgi:hypothetical protein